MVELVRLGEPAAVHHANRDVPVVHVIANTKERAHAWARSNKPGHLPKCHSSATTFGPRGLYLPDEAVFVLDEIPAHVRDAWLPTGCNLVYL